MNLLPDLQSAVQLLAWPWPSADPVPDISTAEHLHPSAEHHKRNTLAVKLMPAAFHLHEWRVVYACSLFLLVPSWMLPK